MSRSLDIDNARSYATEVNLVKAIEKMFGPDCQYIIVCNRKGRFTAIFGASMNPNIMPIHIATVGFKVVN